MKLLLIVTVLAALALADENKPDSIEDLQTSATGESQGYIAPVSQFQYNPSYTGPTSTNLNQALPSIPSQAQNTYFPIQNDPPQNSYNYQTDNGYNTQNTLNSANNPQYQSGAPSNSWTQNKPQNSWNNQQNNNWNNNQNTWNKPQNSGSQSNWNNPQNTGSQNTWNNPQNTGSQNTWNNPQNTGSQNTWNKPQSTGSQNTWNQPQNTGSQNTWTKPQNTGSQDTWNKPQNTNSQNSWNQGTQNNWNNWNQNPTATPTTTTPVSIIKNEQILGDNGSYKYEYEIADGTHVSEEGYVLNPNTEQESIVKKGFYSYTGADGKIYSVTYWADETGFHAVGDHIPKPPPIPPAIQASIDQNAKEEAAKAEAEKNKQQQQTKPIYYPQAQDPPKPIVPATQKPIAQPPQQTYYPEQTYYPTQGSYYPQQQQTYNPPQQTYYPPQSYGK